MAEKNNQLAVAKKVLRRIRRYWPGLILSLVLATVYAVLSLYIPILAGNAIDCIVDAGKVDFAQMGVHLRNILCRIASGGSVRIQRTQNSKGTARDRTAVRADHLSLSK